MGDQNIVYDEQFGFETFAQIIRQDLGDEFWNLLAEGLELPNLETEAQCQCRNMRALMERFDAMTESGTSRSVLAKVRHGVHPWQCAGARERFLEVGDFDAFLQEHIQTNLTDLERRYENGEDFYGDPLTEEVLEFLRQSPEILGGVRRGNRLFVGGFPANMSGWLAAEEKRMKRYHACHCPFAKESILTDTPVSSTLCACSLGHVKNFWEAVFGRELEGEVLTSALAGDTRCRYVIEIPEDVFFLENCDKRT